MRQGHRHRERRDRERDLVQTLGEEAGHQAARVGEGRGETREFRGQRSVAGGRKMSKESTRPPSSSVFVGNIAYDQTEESMKKLFEQVGPVESFRCAIRSMKERRV